MIGLISSVSMLTMGSFFDCKSKKIPLYIPACGGIVALLLLGIESIRGNVGAAFLSVAVGCLPGAVLTVLSAATDKKVGRGDGIVLMALGALEGCKIAFLTFCIGLFLQSLQAVFLLILKKADRHTKLPFLPFLLLGRLLLLTQ